MGTKGEKPIALEAYEALAENYAAVADSKPIYIHYERPVMLSLLAEVKGKRVLDAGCGSGSYSEWLVGQGAEVVAIDVSPKMVQLTRQRLGAAVEVRHADLGQPLDFLAGESFDLILCPLVLHYLKDWDSVLAEFHRLLRKSGRLVFSVHHPFMDFVKFEVENYFTTELVEDEWFGFGIPVCMPFYRRPLGAMIAPLAKAGFLIEQMIEPQPTAAYKKELPEEYEIFSKEPRRLCVRAVKKHKSVNSRR